MSGSKSLEIKVANNGQEGDNNLKPNNKTNPRLLELFEKSEKVFQILQKIKEVQGEDVKIDNNLIYSIVTTMCSLEQTVMNFKNVSNGIEEAINDNYEYYYNIFKGLNVKKLDYWQISTALTPHYSHVGFRYLDDDLNEFYSLKKSIGQLEDKMEHLLKDNLGCNIYSKNEELKKLCHNIYEIWFGQCNRESFGFYSDFISQNELSKIAGTCEEDNLYSSEFKITKGKNGWPIYYIDLDNDYLYRGDKEYSIIIATNRNRNPLFRLKINKSELSKKINERGNGYKRISFNNGKVYVTGKKKEPIDITKCLY